MVNFRFLVVAFLVVVNQLHSQSKALGLGESFIITLFQEKNIEKAHYFIDDSAKSALSPPTLQQVVTKVETQIGKFNKIIAVKGEVNTLFYYCSFEKAAIDLKVNFGNDNKIIGFFLVPHKEEVTEDKLESNYSIPSGTINLKGTLLPVSGNKNLVIFVGGSGPQDRDGTIYGNKPYKDIAEGLYKLGIASYRFDKRSLSNPETLTSNSTIDDEFTNDVVNVIMHFKNSPEYKDYNIILAGHSLGGNLLPRIYSKAGTHIAKLIFLAASAVPLDQLILEQSNYLYYLKPTNDLKNEIDVLKKQIALLHSDEFNQSVESSKLPLNAPASYWRSILDYDLPAAAKAINVPILVIQGIRDYQVTPENFKLWKKYFAGKKNVFFKSYNALNHIFQPGTVPSTPEDYQIKAKVDEALIADIASFITPASN